MLNGSVVAATEVVRCCFFNSTRNFAACRIYMRNQHLSCSKYILLLYEYNVHVIVVKPEDFLCPELK